MMRFNSRSVITRSRDASLVGALMPDAGIGLDGAAFQRPVEQFADSGKNAVSLIARAAIDRVVEHFEHMGTREAANIQALEAPDQFALKERFGALPAPVATESILLLSGTYDTTLIQALGLAPVGRSEFISFTPVDDTQRLLAAQYGIGLE